MLQICDLLFAFMRWGWDDVNLGNDFAQSQAEVKQESAPQDTPSSTEGFKVHQHSMQRNFFSCFVDSPCGQTGSSKMKNKCKFRGLPQGYACGISCTTKHSCFFNVKSCFDVIKPFYGPQINYTYLDNIALKIHVQPNVKHQGTSFKTMPSYTSHLIGRFRT